MKPYKHIRRCLKANCKETALKDSAYCFSHQLEKKFVPMINNPEGYSQHKPNPNPKVEVLTFEQEFMALDKPSQYDRIHELGNKIWREGKELRLLKSRFTKMNKAYFGFDWEEE